MKKICSWFVLIGLLISFAGCAANEPQTLATVTEAPAAGQLRTPPEGYVVLGLADGNVPLKTGGYTWTYTTEDGNEEMTHADQMERPIPMHSMESIAFQAVPMGGETKSEDGYTAAHGCRVSLAWQSRPDTVTGVCWPTDHQGTTTPQLTVDCDGNDFIAYVGSYIYELKAVWQEKTDGYSGEVTYYIHVNVGPIGVVPIDAVKGG